MLLVALVFLSSVVIGVVQRYRPEAPPSTVIAVAVLASFGILVGFLAILVRSWGLRYSAWWAVSYFLLFLIATIVRLFVHETYGAFAYALSALVQLVILGAGPPIISWRAMVEYRRRLVSVSCSDEALEYLLKNRWVYFFTLIFSVFLASYTFWVLDIGYKPPWE